MKNNPIFGAVCYYEFEGDLIDFIKEVKSLGLRWIEYKYDKSLIGRGDTRNTSVVKDILLESGMGISIHTPFDGLNIASVNENFRRESVDELKRSLDYAAEVGSNRATIHGGQLASEDYSGRIWAESVTANLNSLKELALYGKSIGVALCLENGNVYEKEWLKHGIHPGEMNKIKAEIGDDLSFTIDFGHALFFSRNPSYMIGEMGQDNVRMTHLHDNNGMFDSHSDLGSGILNLDALLNCMILDNWSFPVCLEMKSEENLKHSAETLINAYSRISGRSYVYG